MTEVLTPLEAVQAGDRSGFLRMAAKDRLAYFTSFNIRHEHLDQADKALTAVVHDPAGSSIVLLYGPARVGKTTIKEHVIATVLREMLPELEQDRERIPFATVPLRPPRNGRFSWNLYFKTVLTELAEPLIDAKRLPPPEWFHVRSAALPLITRTAFSGNGDALLLSLETAIQHRRPKAVIIDEAQHFGTSGSIRQLQMHLDCIKSLADVTQTLHILIGTYELLPFRNLSAQLSGRSRDIHFSRYNWEISKEYESFIRILKAYQGRMPFVTPCDLSSHVEFLYENSLGCIGNLKANLVLALQAALDEGKEQIEWKHIEQHKAYTQAALMQMARDISQGEKDLNGPTNIYENFRKLIGRPAPLKEVKPKDTKKTKDKEQPQSAPEGKEVSQTQSEQNKEVVAKPTRPRRPGTRNPRRDPTGVAQATKTT